MKGREVEGGREGLGWLSRWMTHVSFSCYRRASLIVRGRILLFLTTRARVHPYQPNHCTCMLQFLLFYRPCNNPSFAAVFHSLQHRITQGARSEEFVAPSHSPLQQTQQLSKKEMFLNSFVMGFHPSIVLVFTSLEYSFINESSLKIYSESHIPSLQRRHSSSTNERAATAR